MRGTDYRGLLKADGPIVVAARTENVGYSELVRIRSRDGNPRLGRVVDLSEDGFMLISETPPEADSIWECRLVLDQPLDGIHEIRVGADCL